MFLALSALLLGACTEENNLDGRPEVTTVPAHISLTALPMENVGDLDLGKMDGTVTRADKKTKDSDSSMDVTVGGDEPATRMTDAEEKVLKNACVFQFDGTSKKLLYSQYVASAGASNDISLAVNDGSSDICVIANMGDLTTTLGTIGTTTVTQFKALVSKTITTTAFASELPMWGWQTGVTVSTSSDISVSLKYMVAKVSFKATLGSGVTLTNIKVAMKQVASQVLVDANGAVTAVDKVIDLPVVSVTSTELAAGTNLSWYIPENKQNAVAGCTNAALRGGDAMSKSATYIEVSGKIGASDMVYQIYLGDGTSTSFTVARGYKYNVTAAIKGFNVNDARVLIGKDLSDAGMKTANCYMVPLAANTWYRFKGTIRGNGRGLGAGYPAADAFAPDNSLGTAGDNNTVKMPGWKINANDLGSGNIGALAPDEAFVLWQTATAEGTGSGLALTSAAWSKSGYVVFCTNSTATEGNAVIAAKKGNAIVWSWHIWKTAYDPAAANGTQTFKVRNNTVESNAWVTAGLFTARPETVMTRNLGAEHNTPATNASGDGKSGGLLYQWGRKDPFIGSKNFTLATDDKNMPFPTITASGYKWADGSTNAGHDAAITATGEGTAAVLDAIAKPMNFFIQKNATTYDWVSSTRGAQNDNLWGNPNKTPAPSQSQLPNLDRGAKSLYDPCPYGWRVAPQDTWTAFTKSTGPTKFGGNNYGSGDFANWNVVGNTTGATLAQVQAKFTENVGWTFYYDSDGNGTSTTNTVYFPASGLRRMESGGALAYVGSNAYNWSTSSFGSASMWGGFLNLHSTWVDPLYYAYRTHGFPVRCVQE